MHGGRNHWGEAGVLGAIFGLMFAASRTFRMIIFSLVLIFCGWWMWTWMHDYTVPRDQISWQSYSTALDVNSSGFDPVFEVTGKFKNLSPNFIEKASLVVDLYSCPTAESATEDCDNIGHNVERQHFRVRPGGAYEYDVRTQFDGVNLDHVSAPRAIAHWSHAVASTIDWDED